MTAELTRAALRDFPLPPVEDGNKYDHGQLLIVAGSRQVPGSAYLCAMAGLRSGAGKVRIATVQSVSLGLALQLPEVLVICLDETKSGGCARSSIRTIDEAAASADCIVAGPGLAKGAVIGDLARAILKNNCKLVLDAAVLRSLVPAAALCRKAKLTPVLLPHSGELAALLERSEEEVEEDRGAAALHAARRFGACVLAKGTTSHIATPDGRLWTYEGGAPGLGISGSGDTLAGIVGGLAARGADPLTALLWGVLLHGEAGKALSRKVGPVGFLAREIPAEIPALLAR